ncbi:hypothetical protein I2W78_20880 [Streptomyces spinoverrucosus]|uniref:hypothetical protein n=1 Tax=Streptomyces spinoverrucosus TaxID=284043 RepID=UPI0018C3E8AC|nr:hypothetical protein [Streptomyces spinoverrucosus]MBG0854221.1 hypothetical protein [Streptomyces spinoverrucosus]
MINPGGIPQYTGDFEQLGTAVADLRKHATGIRNGGEGIHSRFQATAAYYKAPEAEQLFSSTQPVMDTADTFAADIETLADALDSFIAEAKLHADRLKQLKQDAIAFVDSVEGDADWTEDEDKVSRHQTLMDDVAAAVEGFQEAERNAANKINAISKTMCRPAWVPDDGTHASGMYGVDADMLKDVQDLPWGSPEGRTYERWSLDWWGHGVKSWAWDGIAKDSVWGGIEGLGTLVGFHGTEARDEAWDGLRRTFVGAYAYGMDLAGQEEHLSDWQSESKAYAKEFGKQFIAYDMWEEDPARAHAVVTFNLLTLGAGPAAGLAKLSKGGTLGKTAGTLAKIGDALDPVSGGLKAAGALSSLPKVSQVLANVSDHLHLPKTKFPDGALDLSDRYRVDSRGNLIPLNPDGTRNSTPAPREPSAAERAIGYRELVGAGARAGESAARAADDGLSSQARQDADGPSSPGVGSSQGGHGHTGAPGGGHTPDQPGADRYSSPDGTGSDPADGTGAGTDPVGGHDRAAGDATPGGPSSGGGENVGQSSSGQKGVWPARSDIPGPAAGEDLKRPHPRHTVSGAAKGEIKEKNSVILPGFADQIDNDIAGIAAGRARLIDDGNRYEINGRTYGVEPGGRVYPDSGPGIVNLDRNEYAALQQLVRAKGDLNAAPQLTRNPRFVNNPDAVQKALDVYNGTYR